MPYSNIPTVSYLENPAEYQRQLRWLKKHGSLRGFRPMIRNAEGGRGEKLILSKTITKELLQRVCSHYALIGQRYMNGKDECFVDENDANGYTHLREWLYSHNVNPKNFGKIFNQALSFIPQTTFANFTFDKKNTMFKLDKHMVTSASDVEDLYDLDWNMLFTCKYDDENVKRSAELHADEMVNLDGVEHYDYKPNEPLFNEHECLSY